MIRVAAATVAVFAACVSTANAVEPTWRSHLPADWLVAAEVSDLQRLDTACKRLLEPWGIATPPLTETIDRSLPGVWFGDRAWVIAIVATADGGLSPLFFLPANDHQALCESLRADTADDLSVARVAGYDLVLKDRNGWTEVSLLEMAPPEAADGNADPNWPGASDLKIAVSPRGLERFGALLSDQNQERIRSGRRKKRPFKWPTSFATAFRQLAPYTPLVENLAKLGAPVQLGLTVQDEALELRFVLPIATQERGGRSQYVFADQPIATAELIGPAPAELVSLGLTWMQCQPDDIDAVTYPQPEWDDFAEACEQLIANVESAAVVLTQPGENAPLAANQTSVFTWKGSSAELGDALQLVVIRWNALVNAARSFTPLVANLSPAPEISGWQITVDLIAGMGLTPTEELKKLLDRFYGTGGTLRIEIGQREAGDWLFSIGPREATQDRVTKRERPSEVAAVAVAQVSLDRWLAWNARIAEVGLENAIGRRVRPPMAASMPISIRVQPKPTSTISVRVPLSTFDAFAEHWRAEKRSPKKD